MIHAAQMQPQRLGHHARRGRRVRADAQWQAMFARAFKQTHARLDWPRIRRAHGIDGDAWKFVPDRRQQLAYDHARKRRHVAFHGLPE